MAVTIATGVVNVRPDIDEGGVVRAASRAGERSGDSFVRGMDGRLRTAQGQFASRGALTADSVIRGMDGRFRNAQGQFVSLGNQTGNNFATGVRNGMNQAAPRLVNDARRMGDDTGDAFTRGLDGRLRDANGRFVRSANSMGDAMNNAGNRGNRFTAALRGLSGPLGVAGRMLGTVGLGAAKFGGAAGAAVPLIAGLVSSIQNILPAATGAVTALFAMAQASAAIKIGTSGIGEAIKAAFAPAPAAAGAATNAAKQHAKAMEAVQDATENAARANKDAAEAVADAMQGVEDAVDQAAEANAAAAQRVKDAENDLRSAQQSALAVQKELTQARKDAAEELEDLNSRLANSELDLKGAALDVKDAEERLREVQAKGSKATQLERDEAQLALDRAKQRLADQTTETERLRETTAKANKEGISGTEAMTQWRDKMKSANDNITAQEQALADARKDQNKTQIDGQKSIADAEKQLADAREQQAQTAADGQEAIADAMQALADVTNQTATPAVDKFAEAMGKLSPNARAFVQAIIGLKPAWDALKMDVQNTLFQGFADKLKATAASVLPVLRTGLTDTASVLNQMGLGAMSAAGALAADGTLGQAMAGANKGLSNLATIPGKILTAITQLGAAGAPVFDKLTQGIADKITSITDKISTGFSSGTLQTSIQTAMDAIKTLGEVFGNLGEIFGNVFGQFQAEGGGVINMLKVITDALVEVTAAKGFQDMMKALAQTMATLAETAAPLIGEVLAAIAPVIMALAPPLQTLIKDLGAALTPIVQALGPILVIVAEAIGNLVTAFSPLLPVIGNLIADLLPPFMPLLQAISDSFKNYAPLVEQVAQMLSTLLAPVIENLPAIIKPVADLFTMMANTTFPIFQQLLIALMPAITSIADSFGKVLVAVSPLLEALGKLVGELLTALMPVMEPIIELVGELAAILADELASLVENVVVPAIELLVNLLSGDFSGAWESLKDLIGGVWQFIKDTWDNLVEIFQTAIDKVVEIFQYLYDILIGHSIIPDLVNGILGFFRYLRDKAAEVFGMVRDWILGKVRDLRDKAIAIFQYVRDQSIAKFVSLRDGINNAIGKARDWVIEKATWIRDKVVGAFTTLRDKAIGAFNAAKDGIKTAWDKLQDIAKKPVSFIINTVYNNGIRKVWNAVVGAFGGKQLGEIKGFARGGILPGTSTFRQGDDQLVPMRKGEGVYVSEAMKDPYERARLHAVNKAAMSGQPLRKFQGSGQTSQGFGFALGGIFDGIGDVASGAWDKIKGGAAWLKDTFGGAIKSGIKEVINPLIDKIPGDGGFTGVLKDSARAMVARLLGAGEKGDKEAGFAPSKGVDGALKWAKSQAGKPYQWGGAFNPSFDCSGFMSSIGKVIQGLNPKGRLWSTHSFSGGTAPAGWQRNLNSPFKIGITNAGVGHTAGTLKGTNVESRGGDGVVVGSSARGFNNPMFTDWYGFKPARAGMSRGGVVGNPPWVSRDMGGLLPDGVAAVNTSGTAEVVSTLDQLKALVASGRGQTYIFNEGAIQLDASKIKSIQDVVEMIDALKVTSRQFGGRL